MSSRSALCAIRLAVLLALASPSAAPAQARYLGDYLPLGLGKSWTYENVFVPGDRYTESVFESLLYDGQPAVELGTPAEYKVFGSAARVVTMYAFYEDGVLTDVAPHIVIGAFDDGRTFEICAAAPCDTNLIRVWDAIDPTLRSGYGLEAYDDLVLIVSFDRGSPPNTQNTLASSNLPAGVTPPAGAVTGLEWYQRNLGLVAVSDVEAASGVLQDFYQLVGATAVEDSRAPLACGLRLPAPNPSRGMTSMSYAIAQAGRVRLGVYDVSGRRVRELLDDDREAGRESVLWDGKDESGARVGAGLYFVRLDAPGIRATRRLVLLR